ncbi:MAG TPA: hypothetical protein VK676_09225 [Steroidobacteraceae bacterium]|nr:hypothetical protein [Steroidobacteraceae bacterium]
MHNESDPERELARALAALPADDARPYDWREFQRRRAHAAPRRRGTGAGAFAAAAVCALAAVAVLVRLDHHAQVRAVTAAATAPAAAEPRSAERWLASLPREPAVVRVGTRADVLGLEDRIAQVDDLLTAGDAGRGQDVAVLALQRERARLVSSLVQVRYAETLANESR